MTITTTTGIQNVGSEFTINSATSGDQDNLDVVALPAGGFTPGGFTIAYRNSNGTTFARQLDENFNFTGVVQTLGAGDTDLAFVGNVVVGTTVSAPTGSGFDVTEFRAGIFPSQYDLPATGTITDPQVVALSSGSEYVVAYTDTSGSNPVTRLQVASTASDSGVEQFVDFGTDVSVAALTTGGFVTAHVQDIAGRVNSTAPGTISVQRFDSSGNRIGNPVDADPNIFIGSNTDIEILGLPGGGWVLVVEEGPGLVLQVFNSSGNNITSGGSFQLVSTLSGADLDPSIALIDDQFILVTFTNEFSSSDNDVAGSLFNLDGSVVSRNFTIARTGVDEESSSVADSVSDDGVFLTTFTDGFGDGSGTAVRGLAQQIVRTHNGDNANDEFRNLPIDDDDFRDILNGNGGADVLEGFGGRDDFFGGAGNDSILLAAGDDAFGQETYDGGADTDILILVANDSGLNTFDLTDDIVTSIESFNASAVVSGANTRIILNTDQIEGTGLAREANFSTSVDSTIFEFNGGSSATVFGLEQAIFSGFSAGIDQIIINGTSFNDTFTGSIQADMIFGGDGVDVLNGGQGNDILDGGSGADFLDGGAGSDTASFGGGSAGVTVNLILGQGFGGDAEGDNFINIENLTGSAFDDIFVASDDATSNLFAGGAGADTFLGLGGNDFLNGGAGNDLLLGGLGDDVVFGEAGDDVIEGSDGNDTLDGGADDDLIFGQGGDDFLFGGSGADILLGGNDGDTIDGGIGNDTILGGAGDNNLTGGEGDDLILGGNEIDTINGNGGNDVIEANGGNDVLLAGEGDNIVLAGSGNDLITAGAGVDALVGGGGDDTIEGGAGADTLVGGLGNDILIGGDGADQIISQFGANSLSGGAGEDFLEGAAGGDALNGGADNDFLNGLAGNDTLNGGGGSDTLIGGSGADTFVFDNEIDSENVLDFEDNIDQLDLTAFAFADVTTALGAAVETVGGGVFFDFGDGNTALINNITEAQLSDDILV